MGLGAEELGLVVVVVDLGWDVGAMLMVVCVFRFVVVILGGVTMGDLMSVWMDVVMGILMGV